MSSTPSGTMRRCAAAAAEASFASSALARRCASGPKKTHAHHTSDDEDDDADPDEASAPRPVAVQHEEHTGDADEAADHVVVALAEPDRLAGPRRCDGGRSTGEPRGENELHEVRPEPTRHTDDVHAEQHCAGHGSAPIPTTLSHDAGPSGLVVPTPHWSATVGHVPGRPGREPGSKVNPGRPTASGGMPEANARWCRPCVTAAVANG